MGGWIMSIWETKLMGIVLNLFICSVIISMGYSEILVIDQYSLLGVYLAKTISSYSKIKEFNNNHSHFKLKGIDNIWNKWVTPALDVSELWRHFEGYGARRF